MSAGRSEPDQEQIATVTAENPAAGPGLTYRTELSPVSFLRRSAYVYPGKVAVVHGDRRYTYRELDERVNRLASALILAGLAPGDRVAFLAPNIPPLLEAHYGDAGRGRRAGDHQHPAGARGCRLTFSSTRGPASCSPTMSSCTWCRTPACR